MYDGPRPDRDIAGSCRGTDSYQPMRKQGAIILATGGDNSNSAKGNFYEGFMTTGYTSDETDEAVQANIVGVGYKVIDWLPGYTDLGGDCDGNNIDVHSVDSAQACAERCEGTAGCAGVSLQKVGSGARQCYTKSATCKQVKTGTGYEFYSRDAGSVADVLSHYTDLGGDCPGHNIYGCTVISANECALRCEATPDCAGFSLGTGSNTGHCYPKSATCTQVTKGKNYDFYSRNTDPAGITTTHQEESALILM